MKYYSTNQQSPVVDFKTATIEGLAPDKGLYFPEAIPTLSQDFFDNIENLSDVEIAFEVLKPYVGLSIPEDDLRTILEDTLSFDFPLVQINERIGSLELFHGPTFAFKDLGARFMSRCMGYFAKNIDRPMTVLVATSGDTGGAVASGFYDVPGVNVVILYPEGKVSDVQERQLTTLGKNIRALQVKGTFDDCQALVKEAFADQTLKEALFLTSANSINVARWLPQQLFYFYAYKQWKNKTKKPVIAVPSGNFGNICGGLLAHRSGLPVEHFVAACNVNDAVIDYLNLGIYVAKPTIPTISNAMDVGNPSNYVRLLEIYEHDYHLITSLISGYAITDDETKATIKKVYQEDNYLLDPHGAVAYESLSRYLKDHPEAEGFILETAHPIKFELQEGTAVNGPGAPELDLKELLSKEKVSEKIMPDYAAFKANLMQ